jgi:hypothetical protein
MTSIARWLGWLIRVLVLGSLLAVALLRLAGEFGGAALFRYQGF